MNRLNGWDRAGAEPYEGCPVQGVRLAGRDGQDQAKAERDSGAPARTGRKAGYSQKRVGGTRVKARVRLSLEDPEREKPKGAAGDRRAKHPLDREGLLEGSKPRNRGLLGRPIASAAGATAGKTVCGCVGCGNVSDTFREEKAPKGESHERCRCETKPARARRE